MTHDAQISSARLPRIAIVVAMTNDRVIGSRQNLPWHLPEDLQLFKRLTTGGTLIMGRKTYESIGKPLPKRTNLVLSRSNFVAPGIQTCKSLIAGLAAAARLGQPVYIVGGAELYQKALPLATELHISWVEGDFAGDCFFPSFNLNDWDVCETKDFPGFCYVKYQRKQVVRTG